MQKNPVIKQKNITPNPSRLENGGNWKNDPSAPKDHKNAPQWDSPHPPIPNFGETIQLGDMVFYVKYSRAVPPLNDLEFKDLCDDVAQNGVMVPVIVDEDYNIIDGEHRIRAAVTVGLKQIPIQVRPGLTEEEKWKLAEDLNLHRRHLTADQIMQVMKENREKLPQQAFELRQKGSSLRQIGEELGISHQQAKILIQEEVAVKGITAELPEKIVGKDGKRHPAKKPVIQVNTAKELQRAVDACQKIGAKNLPQKQIELKRIEKLAKETEKSLLRSQEVNDFKSGNVELLWGDFVTKGQEIQDNSVDLIFTDPPYEKASLPLWEQLAIFSQRILKPGGLLVSYSGSLYLNQVISKLDEHLTYLWMAAIYHTGRHKKIYPVGLNQAWKPILIYYKPPLTVYWPTISDMVSGGEQKFHHDWEQSVEEALHYIKAFCPTDGVLVDPMMGSGTSLIAGLQTGSGLKCIGIENDKAAYATAEKRVKETVVQLQNGRVLA